MYVSEYANNLGRLQPVLKQYLFFKTMDNMILTALSKYDKPQN